MDNLIFYKLVGEVRQQCRFARIAFGELRQSLQSNDPERTFLFAHSFLGHAVNTYRLLWPERESSVERGKSLRAGLKVGEKSVLQLSAIRRQIEASDEQLEDWIDRQENKNFVDMNVMTLGTMAGFKEDNFHRDLDPENFRMRLRGVECDLRAVSDELHKLETSADAWLRTNNPW